mgnify:CR=1 FL=1
MKRLIFATIVALFTVSVNAQKLCSNCNAEQNARLENGTFSPSVFNPIAIPPSGEGSGKGYGYIEKVQVNSTTKLNLYVYMLGSDGRLFVQLKEGQISKRPGYWPGEFMVEGEFNPETMKYNVPKEIAFTMYSKAVTNQNGQILQKADGSPVIKEERIIISF